MRRGAPGDGGARASDNTQVKHIPDVDLPPRHLKSHLASVAFPAWRLGHEPSAKILCVSYAQELADKLSRDCRRIVASEWYRQIFPTRLSPQRAAMPEFDTTAQGSASPPPLAGC